MARKSAVNLTYKHFKIIEELLNEHLKLVDAPNNIWAYDPGWTDVRIAETAGEPANTNHVNNFRIANFGKLYIVRSGNVSNSNPMLVARVSELEARLDKIEAALSGIL